MKKLFIAILMLITSATTHAQFNKGRKLIGGQVSFSTSPDSDYKSTYFELTPQFGYFIANNLAVGAGVNYYRQNNSDSYLSTSLQIEPFVRYYFKPGIFVQGSYGLGPGKVRTNFPTNTGQSTSERLYNVSSWVGSVGYALFLNDHVAIEPLLGYKWRTVNYKATDSNPSEKNTNSSLYFQVGLQVYLGKRN